MTRMRIEASECWRLLDELESIDTVNVLLTQEWREYLEMFGDDTLISVEIDTDNWDDALASSILFYQIKHEVLPPVEYDFTYDIDDPGYFSR